MAGDIMVPNMRPGKNLEWFKIKILLDSYYVGANGKFKPKIKKKIKKVSKRNTLLYIYNPSPPGWISHVKCLLTFF